ncbi:MAG: hypothetical protein MR384_00230 [Lachnospiraceae bacterium]|nr:hypothetical protein [Lachnospiraceae bacterium]
MTDKLKNDLLKSNIQCINECDGKFVFLRTVTTDTTSSHQLNIPVLFNNEIPVGSFLIAKVSENTEIKTLVFVCCNASQSFVSQNTVKKNLFWYEITNNGYEVLPV